MEEMTVVRIAIIQEAIILGAMMIEQSAADTVTEYTPDSFYEPRHKMIFEAISQLVADNAQVDIISVAERLRQEGNLTEAGGPVFLTHLTQIAEDFLHWRRRRLS